MRSNQTIFLITQDYGLNLRKLLGATDQLELFPASGHMVPEIEDESLREVIYRNYRIIYLHAPEEDKVEVLSVVHTSRHLGGVPGAI